MKKIFFLAGWLVLFMAPAFISCSKDNSDITVPDSSNTVSMKNMTFTPSRLQVERGATVTWINDDNMAHTVTADEAHFNSGPLEPGQRFTHKFNDAGVFNYHCNFHTSMSGGIIVSEIK